MPANLVISSKLNNSVSPIKSNIYNNLYSNIYNNLHINTYNYSNTFMKKFDKILSQDNPNKILIRHYSVTTDGITFSNLFFEGLMPPEGFLHNNPVCHGLLHYAIVASQTYYAHVDQQRLEGEKDITIDFPQIYKTFAKRYQTTPEFMATFWQYVETTWTMLFGDEEPIPSVVSNPTRKITFDKY